MASVKESKEQTKNRRRYQRVAAWLLALIGAFVTALVTGLAAHVTDAVFSKGASATSDSATAPSSAPDQTSIRLVRPFDLSGNLLSSYKQVGKSNGSCIDGYESSDPESLRCFDDQSQVHDPCWDFGEKAACLSDPWNPGVWIIEETKPKDANPSKKIGPSPWALEIRDPSDPRKTYHCGFMGGATGTVAGMRVNWSCAGKDSTPSKYKEVGQALGDPEVKQGGLWKIFFSRTGSSEVVEAPILVVWR